MAIFQYGGGSLERKIRVMGRRFAAALAAVIVLAMAQAPAAAGSAADSFEGVGAQFIIGPDGRYPIYDATTHPARATVLLMFSYYDGAQWKPARCTGWMAGFHEQTSTIITAGHCVYSPATGGGYWHRDYHVYTGYPNWISCPAVRLYKAYGWDGPQGATPESDYGAVKVSCRPSGQPLGQLTGVYGYSTEFVYAGTAVRTQGYPTDKWTSPWPQWGANGVVGPSSAQRLYYDNDTNTGQTGSPIYIPDRPGCGHCVVAIHGGYTDPINNLNNGVRITYPVWGDIRWWIGL